MLGAGVPRISPVSCELLVLRGQEHGLLDSLAFE